MPKIEWTGDAVDERVAWARAWAVGHLSAGEGNLLGHRRERAGESAGVGVSEGVSVDVGVSVWAWA